MATYQRGDALIKTMPQRTADGRYRGLVVAAHFREEPFEAGYPCDVARDEANEALQDADAYAATRLPEFTPRRIRRKR